MSRLTTTKPSRPIGFLTFVTYKRQPNPPQFTTLTTDQLTRSLITQWHALSPSDQSQFATIEAENNAIVALASFDNNSTNPSIDNVSVSASEVRRSPSPTLPSLSQFNFYEPLKLENLRNVLIRLEESIIFALIERSQFKINSPIYESRCMPQFNGLSFLNFFLFETEKLHAKVRRYTSPDEHPYAHPSTLPSPILPQLTYPVSIKENNINVNSTIQSYYITNILPAICKTGDDQNYGSSATCDIQCLQLLSKRIHYGKFVAESKFRSDPVTFSQAIQRRDIATLTELITKPIVEEQVLHRVHLKAATYGSDMLGTPFSSPQLTAAPALLNGLHGLSPLPLSETLKSSQSFGDLSTSDLSTDNALQHRTSGSGSIASDRGLGGYGSSNNTSGRYKIGPDVIALIYAKIMQLNKDVQIEYLLQRLDETPTNPLA